MKLINEILGNVEHLPGVPSVVQQVLVKVGDPNFAFKDLMETVRMDPGITAHVLRMCNSPYYGLRREVSSLQEALTYLGTNNIVQIILSSELVGQFKQHQDGYRLERGELWKHCMACALLAQKIGDRVRFPDMATLFTAALLHDVGKLVLSQYVGSRFEEIDELVQDQDMSFVEAEQQVLGIDHALLGAAVARKWNFPDPIMVAIACHHDLSKAGEHRPLVALVALANLLVVSMGVGIGAEGLAAPAPPGLVKEVGLKPRDLDRLALDLKDILDQADDMLALPG